ncbi:MAG: glycosyltransferase [Desulforhopalus sp.]
MTLVRTALRALQTMNFRILVTLSSDHDKDDLGRIPANVHVMGYTPHSRVLPHCRLVISHAGHGIVTKSMAYGVPMVLVPWGRDQPGVAARAEKLGTAVVVPRSACSVSKLSEAIGKIIHEPNYLERSLLISRRLQNMDGVTHAIDLVEGFLGNS